jgi:pimeloyl-ACP methyl ester carboxylesterase
MQVVGASTSGAIGQYMALDHPHTVRTLTMFASFARFDTFILREFEVRRNWPPNGIATPRSQGARSFSSPQNTRVNIPTG